MREPHDDRNTTWTYARPLVTGVFHTMFRMRFVDIENVPLTGPAVISPNHISPLDPLIVGVGTAKHCSRMIRFLSGTEFFAQPWVGKGLRALDQIPLRRGENDLEALGNAIDAAKEGSLVGLFPEGKINNGPDLLRGRRGAARIAVASGAPLLPVGIWGTQVRFPGGGWKMRRPIHPTVVVVYGEPIPVDQDATSAREILHITDDLMSELAKLRDRAKELAGRKGYAWD